MQLNFCVLSHVLTSLCSLSYILILICHSDDLKRKAISFHPISLISYNLRDGSHMINFCFYHKYQLISHCKMNFHCGDCPKEMKILRFNFKVLIYVNYDFNKLTIGMNLLKYHLITKFVHFLNFNFQLMLLNMNFMICCLKWKQ